MNAVSSSFAITASYYGGSVISASYAETASYVLNAVSSSFSNNAVTASYVLNAVSSSFASNAISSSYALTASFALNGGGGAAFPYTGSATISGSLTVTGPITSTQTISGSRLYLSSSALPTASAVLTLIGSGSELLTVDGALGRLFAVTDDLSDSLFSVNTVAGLPVMEAFATNNVNLGKFGVYPIKIINSGSTAVVSGSFTGSMVGNLTGTASFATSASFTTTASFAATASSVNPLNQSVFISASLTVTGSINVLQNITASRVIISGSTNTASGSILTVIGSGSAQPVFTVIGSSGELFSITDSLSGSLFSVKKNDAQGDTMPVLVDFAHGKPMFVIHTDHHDRQAGAEDTKSTSFRPSRSNVETISQVVSPKDLFPSSDILLISTVDSADFAKYNITPTEVVNYLYRVDKEKPLQKNKMLLGLVINKLLLAFKDSFSKLNP